MNTGELDAIRNQHICWATVSELLSRPSIEMNTIWEPIIKEVKLKKIIENWNMNSDKKKKKIKKIKNHIWQ